MSMFSMISANGDAGLERGLFEGVEVDHDHVDGLDVVLCDGGDVLGVGADVEDAAVDLGVEGLDAAVEHLGEAGEVGDVADVEAGFAEGAWRCRRWRRARRRGRRGRWAKSTRPVLSVTERRARRIGLRSIAGSIWLSVMHSMFTPSF